MATEMTREKWEKLTKQDRIKWLIACNMSTKEAMEIDTDKVADLPDEIQWEILTRLQNAYEGGVCPKCQKRIPDDMVDGEKCSNCGYDLWNIAAFIPQKRIVELLQQEKKTPEVNIVVMDDNGVIEDFHDKTIALNSLDRIRKENEDIKGDLVIAKILHREK